MLCVVDYLNQSTSLSEVINMPNRFTHKLFKMWRGEQDKLLEEQEKQAQEQMKRNRAMVGPGDIHQISEERSKRRNG